MKYAHKANQVFGRKIVDTNRRKFIYKPRSQPCKLCVLECHRSTYAWRFTELFDLSLHGTPEAVCDKRPILVNQKVAILAENIIARSRGYEFLHRDFRGLRTWLST